MLPRKEKQREEGETEGRQAQESRKERTLPLGSQGSSEALRCGLAILSPVKLGSNGSARGLRPGIFGSESQIPGVGWASWQTQEKAPQTLYVTHLPGLWERGTGFLPLIMPSLGDFKEMPGLYVLVKTLYLFSAVSTELPPSKL